MSETSCAASCAELSPKLQRRGRGACHGKPSQTQKHYGSGACEGPMNAVQVEPGVEHGARGEQGKCDLQDPVQDSYLAPVPRGGQGPGLRDSPAGLDAQTTVRVESRRGRRKRVVARLLHQEQRRGHVGQS